MTDEYSADIVPILEAIADRAARLCESQDARIFVVDGDSLRYVAGFGEVPFPIDPIRRLTRGLVIGRAIIDRAVVHIEDMAAVPEKEFPEGREIQRYSGLRTALGVPLLRGDKALGVILLRRSEVRPFDTKHIELVKVFADQAAVAIENLRLSTELKSRNAELAEALEQQTATAEILRVISSSPTDIQPVLDAVAESAARLCEASDVIIRRVDGVSMRIVAHIGSIPVQSDTENAVPVSSKTGMGRAIRERRTIHIHDVLEPHVREEYPEALFMQRKDPGYRTVLCTPLLREQAAIGVIIVRRPEARPFSDKQVKLLETFAAQAVIAIENVRLFNETKEALERQTATSEVLKVISSSPGDLEPVFQTMLENAVRICEAKFGTMLRYDGKAFHWAAGVGTPPALVEHLRQRGPFLPNPGRRLHGVLQTKQVGHTVDAAADAVPSAAVTFGGARSLVHVPMLKDDELVGAIVIYRQEVRPFTDKQIELVKNFAAQAVIAIENTRLLNELRQRTDDLSESLEQQTATAEILKVISSSPTDVQPVFDAIVKSGVHLFGGLDVVLRLVKGNHIEYMASTLPQRGTSIPLSDEGSPSSQAIRRREVVQVSDVFTESWVGEEARQRSKHLGIRAILSAPMMRKNTAIGVINVNRVAPGPFTEKKVALLRTFADQAVIAIENVRLFNETKEALEQQTVISEILRVISSSPTDAQPVFDAIVKSGVHLFAGMNVSLRLVKGNYTESVASTLPLHETGGSNPVPLDDESLPASRSILRREVVQIPDAFAEEWAGSHLRRRAEQRGFRAILLAPLLRDNNAIGSISVSRATPGPFTEKQIALLKTFADQAVIAIENVRLFNEIQDKSRQLEVASRHKSDFLASMSHELRTPLNAILGFNEMILDQVYGEVPADMKEPLEDIQKSGKHLLRLINNVLDLAKIEAGRMELALSDYSVQ
ncbi:MAG: GAF domain-containing protein, partial [Gammaproteobacteria bacterium]